MDIEYSLTKGENQKDAEDISRITEQLWLEIYPNYQAGVRHGDIRIIID
jgi:hypothetical protein